MARMTVANAMGLLQRLMMLLMTGAVSSKPQYLFGIMVVGGLGYRSRVSCFVWA